MKLQCVFLLKTGHTKQHLAKTHKTHVPYVDGRVIWAFTSLKSLFLSPRSGGMNTGPKKRAQHDYPRQNPRRPSRGRKNALSEPVNFLCLGEEQNHPETDQAGEVLQVACGCASTGVQGSGMSAEGVNYWSFLPRRRDLFEPFC